MRSRPSCVPMRGIEDLGVFRVRGQPNLNFTVDRDQASRDKYIKALHASLPQIPLIAQEE